MILLVRAGAARDLTSGSSGDHMRGSKEEIGLVGWESRKAIPREPSHSSRLEAQETDEVSAPIGTWRVGQPDGMAEATRRGRLISEDAV